MNCPHCQTELPENFATAWCPSCGKNLPARANDDIKPTLPPVKINWLIFFAVLLAPALLTTLTASSIQTLNESVSPTIALLGGSAAGIVCGVLLGLRLGKTALARTGLGILFSVVMVIVCVMLCLFGCNLGGYHMRFG